MTHLARLTYFSKPTVANPRGGALDDIAGHAARWNAGHDVTGVLIATRDAYAQLLEGPRDTLSALACRIGADERHACFTIMEFRPAPARVIPHWAMSLVRLKPLSGETPPDFEALKAMGPDALLRLLANHAPAPAR